MSATWLDILNNNHNQVKCNFKYLILALWLIEKYFFSLLNVIPLSPQDVLLALFSNCFIACLHYNALCQKEAAAQSELKSAVKFD